MKLTPASLHQASLKVLSPGFLPLATVLAALLSAILKQISKAKVNHNSFS
jgi:hypothetical protein